SRGYTGLNQLRPVAQIVSIVCQITCGVSLASANPGNDSITITSAPRRGPTITRARQPSPASRARIAACTRETQPSLASTRETCVLVVAGEITRVEAICWFD